MSQNASLGRGISAQSASIPVEDSVQQTLGTAFGQATNFQTMQVTFERGDMVAMLIMYYDDIRGLKARGIVIPTRRQQTQPQAFPGMTTGCTPPDGWKG